MTTTEKRINDLKHAMEIELINNFPNGDLWNKMSDELDELQKKPRGGSQNGFRNSLEVVEMNEMSGGWAFARIAVGTTWRI